MNQVVTPSRTPLQASPGLRGTVARLLLLLALTLAVGVASAQDVVSAEAVGTWEGAIDIPGSPLGVIVKLAQEGEDGAAWTGTVDIPAQGAIGLPLEAISVDGSQVAFAIAGIPGAPTFDGDVEGDAMTGGFTQAGQAFPFSLVRADQAQPGADAPASSAPPAAQGAEGVFADPAGRFTVPVPTGWSATQIGSFVRVAAPEGDLHVDVVVSDVADPADAVAQAWNLTTPDVTLEPVESLEPPSSPGVDRTLIVNYDEGAPNEVFQAIAQVVGDETYVLLVYGELSGLQRRNAQLQVVATGFTITAVEATDLSGMDPLPVAQVVDELAEFVEETLNAYGAPGAAIAVVQDGEVAYLQGFGFTEAGGEPITPSTQMMIGSIGKTLTSMLIASLVDEGMVDWDTPVVDVLPSFAVADETLTQEITFRNLLCACTGVPRRDLELAFNYGELSAEGIIESLATFEFFTDFGEAFQYSNQLVATAGYAAAAAAGAPYGELGEGYAAVLAERILEPIGMSHTTLDIDVVGARGDHATSHVLSLHTGQYEPAPMEVEAMLEPAGPAGTHWSTAEDMAAFLSTVLAAGVAPDGERVVSEESLQVTWEPQVPVTATQSYGLGWFVGEYKGLPMYSHGGNTIGFTSELAFLPEAGLGVVVLTNAQGANPFTGAVVTRLLELLYQQPADSVAQTAFELEQLAALIEQQLPLVGERVPLVDALGFIGAYANPALGEVSLRIGGGQLLLDTGEWVSELRPFESGAESTYVVIDPPVAGLTLRFTADDEGQRTIRLGDGLVSYTFEELR